MLERDIEKAVCDYARKKGLIPYKFTSPNHTSVPDRLFVGSRGLVFFIEFKAPKKTPTAKQWREIQRLRHLGHNVYVVDNIEEGKNIVLAQAGVGPFSVSKEGDPIFAAPRSSDDVAGHGPW